MTTPQTQAAQVLTALSEFNRYFTGANSVDVPARISVPRNEWRQLHAAIDAELRRLDALVAHLTADRDDTANELALRTKHNLALTRERDQLLAKLQLAQESAQAGELPDEREAFKAWMRANTRSSIYSSYGELAWSVWQARAALAKLQNGKEVG